MARLAVAAGIAGVLTAGAAPALADNSISYYSGSASGQAVALQVNPDTVLDVNLQALRNVIKDIDAKIPGTKGTLDATIGSTLEHPTSPIRVTVDSAEAKGIAAKGTELTGGSARSTAVAIDARSLDSEVKLLNAALQNLPSGTVAALQTALDPILANDKTGQLKLALDQYLPALAKPITGALGSPSVNVFQGVEVNFPEAKTGNLTTVQKGGILTPGSSLELQPFEARALPSDAFASNSVDTLALVPTGQLSMVKANQISQSLAAIEAALVQVEQALTTTTNSLGVGSVNSTLTGTVFPVVKGVTGTVDSTTSTLSPAVLDKVNGVIDSIALLRALLGGLDGLQLNQVIGNNGSNAISALGRTGDKVTANGLGNVAHIDVVKVNDPQLKSLLQMVGSADLTELASVDGVKGTATVSLDGNHAATQSANGQLLDVKLLGRSLSYYVQQANTVTGLKQSLALDDILPAGTTCTINIPGTSTCHGIQLLVPVTGALAGLNSVTDKLPTLLNVTLTRGLGVVDQSGSSKYGRADITTLHITSDINCDAVKPVADALAAVKSPLDLGLHLAACGVGVTGATPAAAAAHAAPVGVVDAASTGGKAHLVDLSLGVAHAEVNLNAGSTPTTTDIGGPVPPKTGNDLLILVGVSIAALAAGITLQLRKARA